MRERSRRALAGAFLLLVPAAGGAGRADGPLDVSRFVALGDGLTAGFADGSLFDGATADPPIRLGQRESFAVRVGEALGAEVRIPLVSYPGRRGRRHTVRDPAVCRFRNEVGLFDTVQGDGGRTATGVAANVLAVPQHTAVQARDSAWAIDPSDPSTIASDEDMILGLPAAFEGAPPRSQLATALAQEPTFATVWLGVEDVLRSVQSSPQNPATPPEEFAAALREIVGSLAGAGARGAVANVPDPLTFSYFVPHRELRRSLRQNRRDDPATASRDETCRRVPGAGLVILYGVPRGAYVARTQNAFQLIRAMEDGQPPGIATRLPSNEVVKPPEARRVRATVRRYNREVSRIAAENDWALVDVAALFERWRREGADVSGRRLTTGFLGGLFDADGRHLSPTGHALVAAEFLRAIDAKYGTSHAPPDSAAILAADPLAPCTEASPCAPVRR